MRFQLPIDLQWVLRKQLLLPLQRLPLPWQRQRETYFWASTNWWASVSFAAPVLSDCIPLLPYSYQRTSLPLKETIKRKAVWRQLLSCTHKQQTSPLRKTAATPLKQYLQVLQIRPGYLPTRHHRKKSKEVTILTATTLQILDVTFLSLRRQQEQGLRGCCRLRSHRGTELQALRKWWPQTLQQRPHNKKQMIHSTGKLNKSGKNHIPLHQRRKKERRWRQENLRREG